MQGAQLARAIAQLCSSKPDLDRKLAAVLDKWIKDNVAKGATLPSLKDISASGGDGVVEWYLHSLDEAKLKALRKKFDPHFPTSAADQGSSAHILELVRGTRLPSQKPAPAARPQPMPMEAVLVLKDPNARRSELSRHTPAQLKRAVVQHEIDADQLPSRASKTEIIEHIQAAISSGWPSLRSVMDTGKY